MNRRPRLVAVLLLSLTFGVGALGGMALEEALGLDWFDFLDEDAQVEEERALGGLGLTAAQRERVERILERREDRLEAYWEGRLPEIGAILDSSRAEIRAVLTPRQRARFDERWRRVPAREADEIRD